MNKNTVKKMVRMAELFEQIKDNGIIGVSDIHVGEYPDSTKMLEFHVNAKNLKKICDEVTIVPFMEEEDYTMKAIGTLGTAQLIAIDDEALRESFPNEVAEFERGEQDV